MMMMILAVTVDYFNDDVHKMFCELALFFFGQQVSLRREAAADEIKRDKCLCYTR